MMKFCVQVAEEHAEDRTRELVEHALAAMKREAHKAASSHSAVHDSICEVLQVLGASYERNVLMQNELLCIQTLVFHEGMKHCGSLPSCSIKHMHRLCMRLCVEQTHC